MTRRYDHIQTKLVHSGEPEPRIEGSVMLPVFQSAMFEYSPGKPTGYIRLNNTPNHKTLHRKLADLEGGEDALVSASGMAAISASIMAILSPGDHFLTQRNLYGGTYDLFINELPRLGITFDFIENDPSSWKGMIRPNTKAVFVESVTNPLLQIYDLPAIAAFARENGLVSMIDNTFTTPIGFHPLEHGFDLSIHSCTKYLNGHSDILAGAVIGSSNLIKKINLTSIRHGGCLDPHACFLLYRGIKTLWVRYRYQCESALALAHFLEKHNMIETVIYPGLESHPDHDTAVKLFNGFGGMISFEVKGGIEAADRFIRNNTIPVVAPSLGGVETLISRPATTSHAALDPETRRTMGITDSLVRVSVGIEATEDLVEDFDRALRF